MKYGLGLNVSNPSDSMSPSRCLGESRGSERLGGSPTCTEVRSIVRNKYADRKFLPPSCLKMGKNHKYTSFDAVNHALLDGGKCETKSSEQITSDCLHMENAQEDHSK